MKILTREKSLNHIYTCVISLHLFKLTLLLSLTGLIYCFMDMDVLITTEVFFLAATLTTYNMYKHKQTQPKYLMLSGGNRGCVSFQSSHENDDVSCLASNKHSSWSCMATMTCVFFFLHTDIKVIWMIINWFSSKQHEFCSFFLTTEAVVLFPFLKERVIWRKFALKNS